MFLRRALLPEADIHRCARARARAPNETGVVQAGIPMGKSKVGTGIVMRHGSFLI
jgi:hypothetical protein